MNLKEAKGKVPVLVGGETPYKLVDFPNKEKFNEMYGSLRDESRERYWDILCMRSKGYSLHEIGLMHGVTRERVRQIEARFLRKVASSLKIVTP